MQSKPVPILYSLHNCPYAIRARFALLKAHQRVFLRSIKLDNKPPEMLDMSPKGSVPVLVVPKVQCENREAPEAPLVLDESLEIMIWALSEYDPYNLLQSGNPNALPEIITVIQEFERYFVPALNAFGGAKRYHEADIKERRKVCEIQLAKLEERLTEHPFLFAEQESLVDIALLPFLRKYARIDKQWFRHSQYTKLRTWLNSYLHSAEFSKVMKNYNLWVEEKTDEYFPI
ncbi:glutathione S-transferase [Vibrio rotiferianus]|uniref:Glutathione S-transferase n=1 Tax=Vibrio rotiferianus TaxID=190895 RepID=A0A7Y3Z9H8_9VIBR|nr:glutathione S-transferase [Vibrio rotiferianus]NOH49006.1 glutathione S-transferase [Vibrio rotiferianus]